MDKNSKIIIASVSAIIVLVMAFWVLRNYVQGEHDGDKVSTEECDFLTYIDSVSGITFEYNKDWIVEKRSRNSEDWFIVAHAPFDTEYLKYVQISIVPTEDLDLAVKEWWIDNYEKLNVEENKIYFQHPRTHRYKGVTYSGNRAQFKETTSNGMWAMDYHVMAFQKNWKTLLLVEKAERGGMDGFEADGFIRIEKTINILR